MSDKSRSGRHSHNVTLSDMDSLPELSRGGKPMQLPEVGLLRVDHVGIAVADLDEALAFYSETFGMHCVHEERNEEQGVREAMIATDPDGTGARIQLLAPLRPDSAIAKFLDRNGPGLQQLAYTVKDVEAASDALRARGLRLLYESPRRGTAGSRINFVHPKDAGGVLVELVEPA
ncbi:methylmalonyl-CoA epimerase [Winogradskya humida]|uniref:Methylmalonyl-CoA epimerase n=2 Tax=Winogradskya humida TaxID=113566 RepID=A0ABQ3ZWC6_9ACTN|nr:methylmalonyl-CoA epimerase [Actinoplanes humidus]